MQYTIFILFYFISIFLVYICYKTHKYNIVFVSPFKMR